MDGEKKGVILFITFVAIGGISYLIMIRNEVDKDIANMACFPIAVVGTLIAYGIKQAFDRH